jgi:hypothetical protein
MKALNLDWKMELLKEMRSGNQMARHLVLR